ncbi:iron complex transport system permease protein [Homoserinimonas aerilata]|uniref:Iron complex transport system permease protein n=1 Tax=Homoserinimonas aerilata TaxID=1162970 RepID=A0A542YKU8_9MICO|nr:iron complex transport system permease protein [Homoserinimonas aerilata]
MLVLIGLLSLAVGTKYIPLPEVWTALFAPTGSYSDTVIASRVPRTILGLLVGAALAVAGAVMQGVTRNVLADPGILGVNVGAAAAVVTGIAFFGVGAGVGSVWVALPGAFIAVLVVYVLGSAGGRATPVRLVLAGVVVSAVVATYIQALALSLPEVFNAYRFWVVGSLAGRDPQLIFDILPFIVLGLVLSLGIASPLNALALGEDTARALGSSVGRTRILGALATTVLAAAATAGVGPIAFVGLAVPHIVRAFTGNDHRWLIPGCIVLGPALLLAADLVGRVIVSPNELMVGVVTAFVGGPMLLLVVRRMRGAA